VLLRRRRPVSCTASGAVANPYWNAPVQPLLNPAANYIPYSTFPGGIGTGVNGFNYPYVATLILNYKHDKWAVTPSFQFQAGNRYGAPETMPGVDPLAGCSALGGSVAGDPRYRYGAAGGSPYDATTCAGQLNAIPNSYTGQFDGIGAFRQPAQFLGHLRIEYQVSNKPDRRSHASEPDPNLFRRPADAVHVYVGIANLQLLQRRQRPYLSRRQRLQSARQRTDLPALSYEPNFGTTTTWPVRSTSRLTPTSA